MFCYNYDFVGHGVNSCNCQHGHILSRNPRMLILIIVMAEHLRLFTLLETLG